MIDSANPILAPYGAALTDPAARRELRGWCGLAVLALAVAGVFALLLALSRTPGVDHAVPWPLAFFRKALVVHVVFAFIVWFLAVLGAVMHLAAWRLAGGRRPPLAGAGRIGLGLSAVACLLLFLPAFLDRGQPTLNNYVPAIIDPLYYAGLALLGLGLTLPAARLLAVPISRAEQPDGLTAAGLGAAVVFCLALACFGLAYRDLAGQPASHAFNEELFWGGGHLLQFISTILMLGAWSALGRLTLGAGAVSERLVRGSVVFLVICALPAPVFYFVFPPFVAEQTRAFSGLLWALGPPAVAVAGAAVLALRRRGPLRALPWGDPVFLCLVLSAGVFMVGGFLGMFIDGADTRTPAHYHGVIAGVTLAFMGLFLGVFLPLIGRAPKLGRLVRGLVIAFAAGQTVACIGLFLAGGYGAPRKVAGDAQGLHDLGAIIGMSLNGFGALIAVIGGVLFIFVMAKALLGRGAAAG